MSENAREDDWSETTGATGGSELRSDWSEHGVPSTAVVETVAAARDVDAVELPPLNDHIDPDALDRLLTDGGGSVQISFAYADAEIYVRGDGAVEVRVE